MSRHVLVSVDLNSIMVTLIGYWYRERKIFERLPEIAASVPLGILTQHDDYILGDIMIVHGNLIDDFVDFTKSHGFGKFVEEELGSLQPTLFQYRLELDLGRMLKKSEWWKQNKSAIEREKRRLRAIKKVMNE